MDLEYAWFKKKSLEIAGLDFDSYKPEQMKRLLDKIMARAGVRNYVEFIKFIQGHPARIQEFRDSVTINVSHLFRDYRIWMELNQALADMVERKSTQSPRATLRAWSAGCSIGAEPYTLAILMRELIVRAAVRKFDSTILCTDLDHAMLRRAREGIFMEKETAEVPAPLLKKYFRRVERPASDWAQRSTESVFYEILPELKDSMVFIFHNLLQERWEKDFDLITCRNVLIYFTNDIKEKLFRKFHCALVDGGLLFIGGAEIMFRPDEYGFKTVGSGIYLKS